MLLPKVKGWRKPSFSHPNRIITSALFVPERGMPKRDVHFGLLLQRVAARCQRPDNRHGAQWQRHTRHGEGVAGQPQHGHQRTKKKESCLEPVNRKRLEALNPDGVVVDIQRVDDAELDEMWSHVRHKGNQCWLWHAIWFSTIARETHRRCWRPRAKKSFRALPCRAISPAAKN